MIRINLIRNDVAARPEPRIGRARMVEAVFVLGALSIAHFGQSAWIESLGQERESLRARLGILERAAAQRELQPDEKLLESAPGSRLRSVAAAMPSEVWLVGYREYRGEATMRGMALNNEATQTFIRRLSALPLFGEVEITEATRTLHDGGRELYEFQLHAILDHASASVTDTTAPSG